MDYFIPLASSYPSFSSSTLLLPQPSIASLPQLACDLLVHNLKLTLIGHLSSRDYIPTLTAVDSLSPLYDAVAAYGTPVYQNRSKSITLVLPRSPVIQARKAHHLAAINVFVTAASFKEVLLISGIAAGSREDDGLNTVSPLRQINLASPSTTEKSPLQLRLSQYIAPYTTDLTVVPLIPQGGLTRRLLTSFVASTDALAKPVETKEELKSTLPVSVLLIYALEGDNTQSAFFLADALVDLLALESSEQGKGESAVERDAEGKRDWRMPVSWREGLLGRALGRERGGEMFG